MCDYMHISLPFALLVRQLPTTRPSHLYYYNNKLWRDHCVCNGLFLTTSTTYASLSPVTTFHDYHAERRRRFHFWASEEWVYALALVVRALV